MLKHTFVDSVTLWKKSGVDAFGQPAFEAPVVFNARWEDIENYVISVEKRDRVASGVIYYDGVEQTIDTGDYLYLGISSDLSPVTSSMEVITIKLTKSLSGKRREYSATV